MGRAVRQGGSGDAGSCWPGPGPLGKGPGDASIHHGSMIPPSSRRTGWPRTPRLHLPPAASRAPDAGHHVLIAICAVALRRGLPAVYTNCSAGEPRLEWFQGATFLRTADSGIPPTTPGRRRLSQDGWTPEHRSSRACNIIEAMDPEQVRRPSLTGWKAPPMWPRPATPPSTVSHRRRKPVRRSHRTAIRVKRAIAPGQRNWASSPTRYTLGQVKTAEKSNEITGGRSPSCCQCWRLQGCIVTSTLKYGVGLSRRSPRGFSGRFPANGWR